MDYIKQKGGDDGNTQWWWKVNKKRLPSTLLKENKREIEREIKLKSIHTFSWSEIRLIVLNKTSPKRRIKRLQKRWPCI